MPAISVILPIYNAEPYLRQCLTSIEKQTLVDIEVLCVNDGSKDSSVDIIREYVARDSRFVLLDKPNGGYGHSLNYGLARAKGEYVSIIEPDDFIETHMYEDLYRMAKFDSSKSADVVKGSYWEFYDGRDGYRDALRKPNLSILMPKVPCRFKLSDNPEVFCHHPSIWSAIYRKGFLDAEQIRFVEPKGAGWADNPFLVETLVKANEIVWVPKGYYYYRQTNAGASSFLKDYHVPFDRMREMRSILSGENVTDDILAAYYQREFNYIWSIIGEFGFDERDPELSSLIEETLNSMDESIVLSNSRINSDSLRYYLEFLGKVREEHVVSHEAVSNPRLSIIAPIVNDRDTLIKSFQSLFNQGIDSFEVLIADCGSKDRSLELCKRFAENDSRFRVVDASFESVPKGINYCIDLAQGDYFCVFSPEEPIGNLVLRNAVETADRDSSQVLIFNGNADYAIDVLRASACSFQAVAGFPDSVDFSYGPFNPNDVSALGCTLSSPDKYAGVYSTSFVRSKGIRFEDKEGRGDAAFRLHCLWLCDAASYQGGSKEWMPEQPGTPIPFFLDLHDIKIAEKPLVTPSVLSLKEELTNHPGWEKSYASLLVESFMCDIWLRRTPESARDLYSDYFNEVVSEVGRCGLNGAYDFCDAVAYSEFQQLLKKGLSEYLAYRSFLNKEEDLRFQNELYDVQESATLNVGKKVKELVSTILPKKIIGSLRGRVASS